MSRVLAFAAAAAVLSGCAANASPTHPPAATVSGRVIYEGGPAGQTAGSQPARVVLKDGKRQVVARRRVRQHQRFRFLANPGRYVLVAVSGDAHCLRRRVTVERAQGVTANVVCSVK
jgi:hypothetical protein